MKIGPLRTIALCATCAALAGAGSAALAADDDGPTTTGAPAGQAGHKFEMRVCVKEPDDEAGEAGETEGPGGETCTVTSGDGPPPGGKPVLGGCAVRVEKGTGDKSSIDAAKKKLAAAAKDKCKGGPPFGGCMKSESGTADKAADAAATKAKKAAVARERAAAAAAA